MEQIRRIQKSLRKSACAFLACFVICLAGIAPSAFYAAQVTEYDMSYYADNNFSIRAQGTSIYLREVPEYLKNEYLGILL